MYVSLTGCYTRDLYLLKALEPLAKQGLFLWTDQPDRLPYPPDWLFALSQNDPVSFPQNDNDYDEKYQAYSQQGKRSG